MKKSTQILLSALIVLGLLGGSAAVLRGVQAQSDPVIPDTEGFRFVQSLGAGYNLGNALDTFGPAVGLDTQTQWGSPLTTQEIIATIADAGFATLRLPVTWNVHVGRAPHYVIDLSWLDRVQEIVDWALDCGMKVILNMHCDDRAWFIPDRAHEDATREQYIAIWGQIAARFADYDEELIFEAFNEPRVVGSLLEWAGGTPSQRAVVNRLNAAFVKTIRSGGGGGYNGMRWLLLPTYAASAEWLPTHALKLPDDPRVVASVHIYYPRDFATEHDMGHTAYSEKDRRALERRLRGLYDTFVRRGIPVYIGEFGLVAKDNTAERVRYAAHFVQTAARYGMTCSWWDSGSIPDYPDYYVLLNRRTLAWIYPEIVEQLTGKELE
ncbi:MAG: glycoside hydrolase family 5 protein [Oscillospiraceae bacterium]|jgi:aryl-phospho-beta-D-glucosidase BglC (GH1 family)|nr:glycoside hydrolase family 5 protein [Oscillospiraceae bacterium]